MIPVNEVATPAGFKKKAKLPGEAWLKANPGAIRPKAFWIPFTPKLAEGFDHLCGYAAMLDPTGGTVDHFISFKNRPDLAYEWSNYRFASGPLNSSKRNADAAVLDPYDVGVGWFEIILPSLQLRLTSQVPAAYKAKAEYTLNRLQLRDGERVIRWRWAWYELYLQGKLSIDGLRQVAPLIAAAVDKQRPNSTRAATKK
jgi:hypothetical protein